MEQIGTDTSWKGFDVPSNAAVVTSTYVIDDNMPILYVSHEYDDEEGPIWQFHCDNNDYSPDRLLLVSLESVIQIDESVLEVSILPMNHIARRRYIGDKWTLFSRIARD